MIIDIESFISDFIEFLKDYYKYKSIYDRTEIRKALEEFMKDNEDLEVWVI